MTNQLVQSIYRSIVDAKHRGDNFSAVDFDLMSFVFAHLKIAQAQVFQDLWVLFETNCKRNGYFIEFGAGDGRRMSNTFLLEKSFGWRGIVAEPNPYFHEELKKNRNCLI